MFSNLWRRLTGDRAPAASAADSGPAAPVAAPVTPDAPTTGESHAAPAAHEHETALAALRRSLHWRAHVLLENASREALKSDAPELVESLRNANDMMIRQPPLAAQRALLVARNPESPTAKVAALFENDPGLAQSLLRQANSIYYRRDGAPCTSIHAGVQRVGMKAVQGVLMASLVEQMLCRPGGAFDALVQRTWSHMQRTAPIARGIAPAFGVDAEELFSLALLHDVGKLVVFDHISQLRHDHRRDVKVPDAFLHQLLAHLHEPVGGLAALRWEMGDRAARAIGEHHRWPVPADPNPVTECLYVAEKIELAHTNFTKLDWEQVWEQGGITADAAAVQERLAKIEE